MMSGKPVFLACLVSLALSHGASADWKPVTGQIMTRFAAYVSPTNALPEYPRPQMVRADWLNLNGLWQYQPAADGDPAPIGQTLSQQILVPYPPESALSGLKVHSDRCVYRRTFDVPAAWAGKRVLLHFGAVDWQSTVLVNGKLIGSHRGGYDAFTFDITNALVSPGPQELIVTVYDPTDGGDQPRGKQVNSPGGIFYTSTTGIWQTVWLEPVPMNRIESFKAVPDVDAGVLHVKITGKNLLPTDTATVVASDTGTTVGQVTGAANGDLVVPVPSAKLWSPTSPFLYDLQITLNRGDATLDAVTSYFGMRKIEIKKDANNISRMMLNGQFIFQVGPLDQGFWPDGVYTAPTDAALKSDIDTMKQLGFNMARKHVKVEPDRWYYWCDKLGLMIWQDMPSGNNSTSDSKVDFELEMRRLIEGRGNHPCIIMWVVFNEGWGQYETPRIAGHAKTLDPSRLVDNASGWTDAGAGDVADMHKYPDPGSPSPEAKRAAVLGEFGGLGLFVTGHTWSSAQWSYSDMGTADNLMQHYEDFLKTAYQLKDNPGCSAIVYTQLTDCESECNGLMTYDRILKVDPTRISLANQNLTPPPPPTTWVSPTSETTPQTWKYTTSTPAGTWMNTSFVDSAWKSGPGGFGTAGTPGAIIGTMWNTGDIWLRRTFNLASISNITGVLRVHHDEDAEVYINGVQAATFAGYSTGYSTYVLGATGFAALQVGTNTLAVHCHQTTGGQYIDVGVGTRAAG